MPLNHGWAVIPKITCKDDKKIDEIIEKALILLKVACGQDMNWCSKRLNRDGEDIQIILKNVCIFPSQFPAIITKGYDYHLQTSYPNFEKLTSEEKAKFLLSLRYFLKSRSEASRNHQLMNAILALEILSKVENCKKCKTGFHVEHLKDLLTKYEIDYQNLPCFKIKGKKSIMTIRGSLMHRGEYPREAPCDALHYLFVLYKILSEIYLKMINSPFKKAIEISV